MTLKQCSKCKRLKPLAQFSRARQRPDGHQARCKDCHRAAQREYRQANPGTDKRSYERSKNVSRVRVMRAVNSGKLPRVSTLTCAIDGCGKAAQHYHHLNYDRSTRVAPVCAACHAAIHLGEIKQPLTEKSISYAPQPRRGST